MVTENAKTALANGCYCSTHDWASRLARRRLCLRCASTACSTGPPSASAGAVAAAPNTAAATGLLRPLSSHSVDVGVAVAVIVGVDAFERNGDDGADRDAMIGGNSAARPADGRRPRCGSSRLFSSSTSLSRSGWMARRRAEGSECQASVSLIECERCCRAGGGGRRWSSGDEDAVHIPARSSGNSSSSESSARLSTSDDWRDSDCE